MNHQGQAQVLGTADVAPEALALPFHVCQSALAQAVIVQACLANANDLRVLTHGQQIVQSRLLNTLFVRVNACGTPKIVMRHCHGVDIGKGFHAGADEQSSGDLRFLHGLANIAQIGLKFGKIQVAMRVGVHGSGGIQGALRTADPGLQQKARVERVVHSAGAVH